MREPLENPSVDFKYERISKNSNEHFKYEGTFQKCLKSTRKQPLILRGQTKPLLVLRGQTKPLLILRDWAKPPLVPQVWAPSNCVF